jgi:hypothetical protein
MKDEMSDEKRLMLMTTRCGFDGLHASDLFLSMGMLC